ncbi:N-acetyltransferase [Lacisediminihabitans profunda]|uniref:N-acetyltransferase n=1 Tax=Lacisediminihabitans profunda TaxID=2594790 RepID=UPI00164F0806|nr:N-acetyltransferase [Lacisediminihabitans profunda]
MTGSATHAEAPVPQKEERNVPRSRFRGWGIAAGLIAHALDDIREGGLRIIVQCPVVAAFIGEHREYTDLVDPARPS